MNKTYQGECELCERFATTLSEHHLIPRTMHSNKRVKKMFTRAEMVTRTADFCHPCHRAVHAFWHNKELALEHNSIEELRTQPEIQRHIVWVRKQQPGFKSKGRRKDRKEKQW